MFIVLIDSASNEDCSSGLIVTISFFQSLADLELDIRILGVDLVESIDKRIDI